MLTKDLVQATVRNGKLFPKFIKPDDAHAASDAKDLCALFTDAKGRVVSDIEEDVKGAASTPRGKGFAKLLMDRCEVAEPGDEIMELRWRVFAASEKYRVDQSLSQDEFAQAVAQDVGETIDSLREKLFADLPSARSVERFDAMTPDELIEAYNLSHVTTFLCFAEDVAVTVSGITLPQKRELMRRLKFHRLMSDVEVDKNSNSLTLELSGPLRLFGKTQGYALRIANFFPFVASLPEWRVEALITWRGKKVNFVVDHKSGVRAKSARSHGGYIPKEFEMVLESIADGTDWKITAGADFIHLGKQSYCFPDFEVTSGKKTFGIELFHPWHKGQLKHRIEAASKAKATNLLIGVERSLLKDPEMRALCDQNPWFANFGFEYSQFPTPNVVKRAVAKHV